MSSKNATEEHAIDNPDQWVDRYGDMLCRFAMARVKDPSIAEDLVQETFLAALHSIPNFSRVGDFHRQGTQGRSCT